MLHDGRPGHLSQALGLAQRLCRLRALPPGNDSDHSDQPGYPEYSTDHSDHSDHSGYGAVAGTADAGGLHTIHTIHTIQAQPRPLWRALALRLCRGRAYAWVRAGYRLQLPATPPDLLISFGGRVVPLNAALARLYRCPNILIGNRYGLPAPLFTVLVNARGEGLPNQVVSAVPFSASPAASLAAVEHPQPDQLAAQYPAQHSDGPQSQSQSQSQPLWLLLIGGDGSGYGYTPQDWQLLLQGLVTLAARWGIRWLVSTSRRTPPALEVLLDDAAVQASCAALVCFHRQPQSIRPLLLAARRIFVSEDSLSMLTEAVACDKPVTSLQPARMDSASTGVHQQTLARYRQLGLVTSVPLAQWSQWQPETAPPAAVYSDLLQPALLAISRHLGWPGADATAPAAPCA